VTETEFLRSLPGESTKLSAALALFKIARVLSRSLKEVYQTAASYDVSIQTIETLKDELDQWLDELAPHLRLQFENDKPSTKIVSNRAPLLVSWPSPC
jgi:predicted Zn-dependent peptidase